MSHWEASLPTAASGFPHRGQRERALLRPQTVTRAARSPVPDLSGPRGTERQLSAPALRRAAICQPSPGSSVFLSGSAGSARDSPFEVTKPHFLPRRVEKARDTEATVYVSSALAGRDWCDHVVWNASVAALGAPEGGCVTRRLSWVLPLLPRGHHGPACLGVNPWVS